MSTATAAILEGIEGGNIALKDVAVEGSIRDLLSEVTVFQTYKNEGPVNIEAVYTFPLPLDAVLLELTVKLGERTIAGHVVAKTQAEERYEQAITDGDTAVMLQQPEPGLYAMNVGNLQPGETAVIRFRFAQLQRWNGDLLRFMLPTVVAPRYGDPGASGLAPHQQPTYDLEVELRYRLDLKVSGLLAAAEITSPSHQVLVESSGEDTLIRLDKGSAFLDRDFVLNFCLPNAGKSAASFDRDKKGYVALASFKQELGQVSDPSPRDVSVVVDCSGSMAGDSIAQAREALLRILDSLRPQDHYNIVAFGSSHKSLFKSQIFATGENLEQGREFVRAMDADLGGTEIGDALKTAYRMEGEKGLSRDILLITDGEVWDDGDILQRAKKSDCRIFTVGVGSAVCEGFVRRLAEETGGACELVSPKENMAEKIHRHFLRIYSPRADAVIDWPMAPCQLFPATLGPVYAGDTLHVFAWFETKPVGEIVLTVTPAGRKRFTQRVSIRDFFSQAGIQQEESAGIPSALARLAAASKLRNLEDVKKGAVLAEEYQLMSPWTNYLLIDLRPKDKKAEDLPELRRVPQMLTAGWGGIGSVVPSSFLVGACFDRVCPSFVEESRVAIELERVDALEEFVENFNQQFGGSLGIKAKIDTIDLLETLGLPQTVCLKLRELVESGLSETEVVASYLILLTESNVGGSFNRDARRVIQKAFRSYKGNTPVLNILRTIDRIASAGAS